ncbi:iron reductase domain protein [Parathielavia appendiculata]|uniref:Iron reductase domain protein n=1 Tax=Parathielavia appendiculata TaxID=2587402 RepID=A0AAN6Z8A5_9PEZI|nr:iron reductase domain protein [Parathielavia appendiculata]
MLNSVLGFSFATLLWLASLAVGAPLEHCPSGSGGVCFSIAVPTSSANSGSGNVYFQIKAPTSLQWVALGTGSAMSGSNIFLMYQDGKGNVTLSPRLGQGYSAPQLDTSPTAARLTLLAGSGVSDDGATMTANVACSNCDQWSGGGTMSLSSTAAGWIAAWKRGSPLATIDQAVGISRHDGRTLFTVDLTRATVNTDSNPFVTSHNTGGGSSSSGNGSGSGSGSGLDSGSGSGISEMTGRGPSQTLVAHGSIMAVVMLVLFPMGSLLMPLFRRWWLHGTWQLVGLAVMWAGIIVGIVVLRDMQMRWNDPHFIVGLVVAGVFTIQPALGLLHHRQYVKTLRRSMVSHVHRWLGRVLMALGTINGGLGLRLARAPERFVIAYGTVAGVVYVGYAGYKLYVFFQRGTSNAAATDNDTDRSKEGHRGQSRR